MVTQQQRVIDHVHQTHLIEAIKYLGRAIALSEKKKKRFAWQRHYTFSQKERDFLQEMLRLLETLNQDYESWQTVFIDALHNQKTHQYGRLLKSLSNMTQSTDILHKCRIKKKYTQGCFNQLMVWVHEEVEQFLNELGAQLSTLKEMDFNVKLRERDIIRSTLFYGHTDINKISKRLSSFSDKIKSFKEKFNAKTRCRLFSPPHFSWLSKITGLINASSESLEQLYTDINCQADRDGFPESYYQLSKTITQYSHTAKIMMEAYLLLSSAKEIKHLTNDQRDEFQDIILQCQVLFDTLKSLRSNCLKLLLYKVDHHRCKIENGKKQEPEIKKLLNDKNFEILRYSFVNSQQPRLIEQLHEEVSRALPSTRSQGTHIRTSIV